jgi:hypothetical protein
MLGLGAALRVRLRGWWRAMSLPGRAALAIGIATLVLLPPFSPPVPWRWVTDRVPERVAERVPWAFPTRALQVRAGECDSSALAGPPHAIVLLTAFGHSWASASSPGASGGWGSFRQSSRTRGVFTPERSSKGVSVRSPSRYSGCY